MSFDRFLLESRDLSQAHKHYNSVFFSKIVSLNDKICSNSKKSYLTKLIGVLVNYITKKLARSKSKHFFLSFSGER